MVSRIQIILTVTLFVLVALEAPFVSSLLSSTQSRDSKQEQGDCHLRELDLCLASVAVFTQSSSAHPVTNNEINRQCKLLNETETCISNFTTRCFTDQQSKLFNMFADGGLDTIRNLCKPQSKVRDLYLKHGDCLNKQEKAQRVCMRDFQVSLEKAADITWQDRLKLLCCSFNKMNACIKDIIEPKCGKDAYEMSQLFFRATFSRLPAVSCAKYDHSSKSCAALLPPAGTTPKGSKSHSVLSKFLAAYTGN